MSIAFVSESANTGTTITAPSGIVAGNLLLLFVGTGRSAAATASGFTAIGTPTTANRVTPFYKWATGSEPSSYTVGPSSFTNGAILQYSGVDATTPIDVYAFSAGGTSTPASLPSLTTTNASEVIVQALYDNNGNAASTPSGLTNRASYHSGTTIYAWDSAAASAGGFGPWSTDLTGGPGIYGWGSVAVALKAASGGPTAATATGTLTLAGTAAASAGTSAAGSLTLSGTGTATAPFTLTVVPSGAQALLSWPAAGASYVVERDGANVAFGVTGTSYTDTPPTGGSHTYRVGVLA